MASGCYAQELSVPQDSLTDVKPKTSFFRKIGQGISKFISEFTTYDTAYIEPQHYKFQVMCQLTNDFEFYDIESDDGTYVRFSPEHNWRFGPYAGYSLLFLGYTIQLNNLYIGNTNKKFDLSLYSGMLGADFYYRNSNDFHISNFDSKDGKYDNTDLVIGESFDGFKVKSLGFNAYYIFKHRRHSYPAAYNQSTCQKISSGAPLAGFGYGSYDVDMNWQLLGKTAKNLDGTEPTTTRLNYDNYSLYGGYSYNWVFARNWLLGISAIASLSYNQTKSESFQFNKLLDGFKFSHISLGGVGRMGIVWNNTRYFFGASINVHVSTYRHNQFYLSNLFGNSSIYCGFNFGKKKAYRKPGKFFEF